MEKENAYPQIPRQRMAFAEAFIMSMETTTQSMAQPQQKMHGETSAIDTRQLNIQIMDLRMTSRVDLAIMEKYRMKQD